MKKGKVVLLFVVVLALVVLGVFRMTAVWVDPPIPGESAGSTVVFYRRLTNSPFLFSTDSLIMKEGAVPTVETRRLMGKRIAELIGDSNVIFRLKYNKALYLKTTGNKDFVSPKE